MGLEMNDLATDFRLGIKCKGFDLSFLGFCRKNRKGNLGSGMRHSFCRVPIGARKEIVLML